MNENIVSVCLALFLVVAILITPSSGAEDIGFPNISTSLTHIYFLDVNGNCELYTIITIRNLDHDYSWEPDRCISVPIPIRLFSGEQPNVTMVTFGDVDTKYEIIEHGSTPQSDQTYTYEYHIAVCPPVTFTFHKNDTVTIGTKNRIDNVSSKVTDYNKFRLPGQLIPKDTPFKDVDDFIVRVNLPNNPYYWSEVLHTTPNFDYRTSFGRGESLEWWYNKTDSETDPICIYYRIHADPLKKELDKATQESRDISRISLGLGIIAFILGIISMIPMRKDIYNCLCKKAQGLEKRVHSTIYKYKNRIKRWSGWTKGGR